MEAAITALFLLTTTVYPLSNSFIGEGYPVYAEDAAIVSRCLHLGMKIVYLSQMHAVVGFNRRGAADARKREAVDATPVRKCECYDWRRGHGGG
jgi:hypothetical protein